VEERPGQLRAALVPALIALLGCGLVVAVGLLSYDGHVSRFVHAGTYFVVARHGLVRQPGAGYDGQFVYRLSLAPLDVRTVAHGIRFDTPLRTQRIGLPLLAWLLAGGGHAAAVPAALLGINIASLTAIAGMGGMIAGRAGRQPAWGALLAAPAGLQFSLLHDLTEPLEIALLLAGLLLLWADRYAASAGALAAAALTRETALLLVAAVALPRLRQLVRDRRPARHDAVWLTPVVVWLAWQAYIAAATGASPLGRGGRDNVGLPLAGAVDFARSLPHAAWHHWPLFTVQLVFVVVLVVMAVPGIREAQAPVPLALLLYGLFSLCVTEIVWSGWDDLRFLIEPMVLLTVVLLLGRRRLSWFAGAAAAVWALSLGLNRF
jgi:hypothetical protein